MKAHAETALPKEDVTLFRKIQKIVQALSEPDIGSENGEPIVLSCHHLAHALAELFSLKAVDGYSPRRGYRHSWLETENGNIIDVYPVDMVGGPILLAAGRFPSPWRPYYLEHPIDFLATEQFTKELRLAKDALQKMIGELNIEI
jgi:hypothetical protein